MNEHDSSIGGEDGVLPPFLLETTEFVAPQKSSPRRFGAALDMLDNRRPPYELLVVVGLVSVLAFFYFGRSDNGDAGADPLSAASAPSSIIVTQRPASLDDLSAGAGLDGQRPPIQTLPLSPTTVATTRPTTTAPPTTEPTTTTTTTTTTTVETTTSLESTTTITQTPTDIIELNDCILEFRGNTRVYATPSSDNEVGTIRRGEYRATLRTSNWFLISTEAGQGWVKNSRVRNSEGDCSSTR